MEDSGSGEPDLKKQKTRSAKGTVNKSKQASAKTVSERISDFPKGVFIEREGSDGMWCTACGVEVHVSHKNFGPGFF